MPRSASKILIPQAGRSPQRDAAAVLLLLVCSATSLAVAPLVMPEGYSWLSHTTSESAAQGTSGAWLARFGFLSFGLAVVWLAEALQSVWARGAKWMHLAFGVLMISTAAFSHRPWVEGVAFDATEDLLHSVTATAMGFAFALGVVVRLLQRLREKDGGGERGFDVVAVVAATVIPLTMLYLPTMAGIIQRAMFTVAYLWYGNEAWQLRRVSRGEKFKVGMEQKRQ